MIYLEYHGEIKPCPYCESKAGLFNIGGEYAVRCKSSRCRLESDAKSTKDEAVSYWNKRVEETAESIARFRKETKTRDLLFTWRGHLTEEQKHAIKPFVEMNLKWIANMTKRDLLDELDIDTDEETERDNFTYLGELEEKDRR